MQKFVFFCERYGIALIPLCLILLACGLWPEMELLVPSLPDMKRVFDVQDSHIQQLLTVNFVGFLIGVLIAGPLCDSAGRKTVLLFGAIGYLLASLASALTTDFTLLMGCRFFQGLFMTGPVIAGSVLLLEATSGVKQVFWMSLGNSAVTFCMAAAPLVGSWINSDFGYKGNLWGILLLGFVGILPSLFFVSESLHEDKKKRLNLFLLFKGYMTLLKDWRFISLAVPICSLAAAYWIYVAISALYIVDHLGIPASSFGRYQGPIVGFFSLVSLCSSKLMQRFGLIRCLKGGVALMATGCFLLFGMSLLSLEHALYTTLFMMLFVGGMAPVCSLLFPQSVAHLPSELQGNAQAMINAIRLLFASTGTFILGFVYSGPLLPVSCMLLLIFLMSVCLLWKGRKFIEENQQNSHIIGGGH
jgi:DHA1 family bicyclomycin/chloramphenicol resistance-like MFS transporter